MIFISNRGNINGINQTRENNPEYVQEAMDRGFFVMVDVWLVQNKQLTLGNVKPKYVTDLNFLQNPQIIARACSPATLTYLLDNNVHCFYCDRSNYTLTSNGYVWTWPGSPVIPRSIVFMPEWFVGDVRKSATFNCTGVCSNFILAVLLESQKNQKKDKLDTMESIPEEENDDLETKEEE